VIIKLSEDRAIISDVHQFALSKFKTRINKDTKKKEQYWEPYLYFSRLESALTAVPEQFLKESDANGWLECKAVLDDTRNLIADALADHG